MNDKQSRGKKAEEGGRAAFLLAQVGAHAAMRFAERLEPLALTPAYAGILRIVRRQSGVSQQDLAGMLGMFPSRLVLVLDEMQNAGLVERRARPGDRRISEVHLTPRGEEMLQEVSQIAREHQDSLCSALTAEERGLLADLLGRIAEQQGIRAGVHPGFGAMGNRKK